MGSKWGIVLEVSGLLEGEYQIRVRRDFEGTNRVSLPTLTQGCWWQFKRGRSLACKELVAMVDAQLPAEARDAD